MEKLQLLDQALSYIEENLLENIKTEEIANHCYCSKSSIEKLFRNVNHISVHDYMVRRKMVLAARALRQEEERNILSLALSLGYQSHEAFSRAFKQVWNCNPSEFKEKYQFTELFPRYNPAPVKGVHTMARRVDISELYDLFLARRGCYFVCCDIKGMCAINDVSRKAGDIAILTAMKRMSDVLGEEDVMFRIGGDEFTILTDSADISYAQGLAERILSQNGGMLDYAEQELALDLHVSVVKLESTSVRYRDLFQSLHTQIECNKIRK